MNPDSIFHYHRLTTDQQLDLFDSLIHELVDLKHAQRALWLKTFLPWYERKTIILHELLSKHHIPHHVFVAIDPWTSISYKAINWDHLPIDRYQVFIQRVKPDFEGDCLDILLMTQIDFDDHCTESEKRHLRWIQDHQETSSHLQLLVKILLQAQEQFECELIAANQNYWHG